MQKKINLDNPFNPYKFSDPIDQWDYENNVSSCCCQGCTPTDEPHYPFLWRDCWTGDMMYGPKKAKPWRLLKSQIPFMESENNWGKDEA